MVDTYQPDSRVRLAEFDGSDFDKGASKLKQALWYFVNALVVRNSFNPLMAPKIWCLKLFGAKIGKGLYIKNEVRIKAPWRLIIGDNCWIGEKVWIDNLETVVIGNNVCLSQGSLIITGNHDYSNPSMPYRNAPIHLDDGVWIGAQAIVCPGVYAAADSMLSPGSVATNDLKANAIYRGNPAQYIRERFKDGQ